ncbi:MAG: ComF family protein, partial [Gemmatimonadota bacterium]
FPPCCVLCRRSLAAGAAPLCPVCRHRLPRVARPRCARCGATDVLRSADDAGCPACWEWPEDLPAARSPFRMEAGAAELVRALKYGGWSRLAPPMGRTMERCAAELASGTQEAPTLVPVPLTRARRRERGFNQAELLALALAEATGWEVERALLRRPGGRRQASLGRSERLRNVEAGFAARGPSPPPEAPAILVDDVLTTGATASACSAALEAAGWASLGTVVFARALHPIP